MNPHTRSITSKDIIRPIMAENYLEIHVTNGDTHIRIIIVEQTPNGVYVYWCDADGQDTHISYHADGNVFSTIDKETKKIAAFQPLKEFKGSHQIFSLGFSSDMTKLRSPLYNMTQAVRSVAYVDIRSYMKQKCDIGCNITLVEPNSSIVLDTKNIVKPLFTEFHLFPEFNPWILVSIYKAVTDRHQHQLLIV
jgi:hypothetical protein